MVGELPAASASISVCGEVEFGQVPSVEAEAGSNKQSDDEQYCKECATNIGALAGNIFNWTSGYLERGAPERFESALSTYIKLVKILQSGQSRIGSLALLGGFTGEDERTLTLHDTARGVSVDSWPWDSLEITAMIFLAVAVSTAVK